ncbi:MAG: hypothetical protein ABSB70_05815 [Candidatus Velthaea sp.]|jgi:hypothetical protein
MRAISAQRILHCAWPGSNHYVEAFYARLADDGRERTLPLRVRLADIGLPSHLSLEREVRATFVRLRADENPATGFHIQWEVAGGGPYPRFTGWLFLHRGADDSTSVLELEGTYTAPFGPVGAFFDAAIGKSIAESTADALLTDIVEAIEGAPALEITRL